MDSGDGDETREWALFGDRIDPIAREVLEASDPWDAYRAANGASDALVDDLNWLPHGGAVYVAWAELTDTFETGRTPISDAHNVLRRAAINWLERPATPAEKFIEGWIERANADVESLVRRDGNFWRSPS